MRARKQRRHVAKTGDIKDLVIIEESGIAKGIRRIIAITGEDARSASHRATDAEERFAAIEKLHGKDQDKALKIYDTVRSPRLSGSCGVELTLAGSCRSSRRWTSRLCARRRSRRSSRSLARPLPMRPVHLRRSRASRCIPLFKVASERVTDPSLNKVADVVAAFFTENPEAEVFVSKLDASGNVKVCSPSPPPSPPPFSLSLKSRPDTPPRHTNPRSCRPRRSRPRSSRRRRTFSASTRTTRSCTSTLSPRSSSRRRSRPRRGSRPFPSSLAARCARRPFFPTVFSVWSSFG